MPESLNEAHELLIVATELDDSTERIINYLTDFGVSVNAVFFRFFCDGGNEYLSRAWLIEPNQVEAKVSDGKAKGPWNGEFYVSYGSGRSWEDARRYGYISGGGGSWYSQTLKLLSPGDRVWVKIPKTGYVGVGHVVEPVQSSAEFTVSTPEGERLAMDVVQNGAEYRQRSADPETAEYFVRVEWLQTVPAHEAFNEIGLFGNQNTVCQPTTPKWRHTVERLRQAFPRSGAGVHG